MNAYQKPTDADLRRRLTRLQYEVTQHEATEPPFFNEYNDHKQPGLYVDVATGEPLFSSLDKYESGSGWPSFTKPLAPELVVERRDDQLAQTRTEVRSRHGGSHLGHVFPDGPAPTGLRYCINSAALRFVPLAKLEHEGYGSYRSLFSSKGHPEPKAKAARSPTCSSPGRPSGASGRLQTAVLAGGCFWGMEEILRKIPGVVSTRVGYTGGAKASPSYDDVRAGATGHAEAVEVAFDPRRIGYEELLAHFFRMHDPTTLDRQGNDVGSQYRSAIFYTSDEQRQAAELVKERVSRSGKWPRPIVTEIAPASAFWPAEDYHQRYLQKHPDGYTCHYLR